jgi:hypothetical protein
MVRPTAIVLLCLALASCASIPLSTIARMSHFDESDFATLDANAVRIRIALPQGFELDAANSRLRVKLVSGTREREDRFDLEAELVEPGTRGGGLFSAPVPCTVHVLRLTGPSRKTFGELQAFATEGRIDVIDIGVRPAFAAMPEGATSVTVWIDLLLSPSDGWFTLMDGARVELGVLRTWNRPGN